MATSSKPKLKGCSASILAGRESLLQPTSATSCAIDNAWNAPHETTARSHYIAAQQYSTETDHAGPTLSFHSPLSVMIPADWGCVLDLLGLHWATLGCIQSINTEKHTASKRAGHTSQLHKFVSAGSGACKASINGELKRLGAPNGASTYRDTCSPAAAMRHPASFVRWAL